MARHGALGYQTSFAFKSPILRAGRESEIAKAKDAKIALAIIYRELREKWTAWARWYIRSNESFKILRIPHVCWTDPVRNNPEFIADIIKHRIGSMNFMGSFFSIPIPKKERFVLIARDYVS